MPLPQPASVLDFTTQKGAFKGTRLRCDALGVPYVATYLIEYPQGGSGRHSLKDIICACLYEESRFRNYTPDGTPTIHKNADELTGHVWSTDWGIAQINDHPNWHIGPGLPFASVQDVLDHPQRAVEYMIKMALAGKLGLWSSYKFKHYKEHLHPSSGMWLLKN